MGKVVVFRDPRKPRQGIAGRPKGKKTRVVFSPPGKDLARMTPEELEKTAEEMYRAIMEKPKE